MTSDARFWVLDQLSNQQLLASLGMVLRNERQALADLIAHLGEVEERRLHLEAAYGSMFDYCVRRLGMSEDEACRRIELARVARRFPALFPLLAAGDLSLSVALVLKPVLTADNHLELLAAARGKSIWQARELVAARFPSPDVASKIRRLPERHSPEAADTAPLLAANHRPTASSGDRDGTAPAELDCVGFALSPAPMPPETTPAETPRPPAPLLEPRTSSRPVQHNRIEPLSAQRYKVQFTADLDLKTKLEQARDLLRHTYPNGDFGPIVSRALDLLIAELMRRRFGVGARRKASSAPAGSSARAASSKPAARSVGCEISATPPLEPTTVGPSTTIQPATATPSASSPHIPLEARRTVVERDGLGCTWVGADGTRCGCQAWLEIDHRKPRGKGGASEPNNLRVLCRAHNRLAAEREYGRARVERATARRRAREGRPSAVAPRDATAH